jgi:hypothetical protein
VIWSFSNSRAFDRCQRSWFYDTIFGNGVAKDEKRHEIYLLSKLQTVSAWRGSIVDKTIETSLVPALKSGRTGSLQQCVARARHMFNAQRTFALRHGLRDDGLKLSKAGNEFAAFLAVERSENISDEGFATAWEEIERALNNLFGMTDLLNELRQAEFIMTQRALQFKHGDVTVKAVPDLVAIYRSKPPLIVDWKVHFFGTRDYWLQLATYALALTRCSPHRDFPLGFRGCEPTAVRLIEVLWNLPTCPEAGRTAGPSACPAECRDEPTRGRRQAAPLDLAALVRTAARGGLRGVVRSIATRETRNIVPAWLG